MSDLDTQHRLGQHYTKEVSLIEKYNNELLNVDGVVVDPFCGEGHLLEHHLSLFSDDVAKQKLEDKMIMGFDVSEANIDYIKKLFISKYGISDILANNLFQARDSLNETTLPENSFIFTNPPYLSKVVCKRKFKDDFDAFFGGKNSECNDYFEIALKGYGSYNGIWIVPANLFSSDIMGNTRKKLIGNITGINIYEEQTFSDTGISITTFVINHSTESSNKHIVFNRKDGNLGLDLDVSVNGNLSQEWDDIKSIKNTAGISQGYIDSKINPGTCKIKVLDVKYKETEISVSQTDFDKLNSNILYLRTTDTGTSGKELGLYTMEDIWGNSGAKGLITKISSRVYTQVFINLSIDGQLELKKIFNSELKVIRKKYNSIFLTNYKNSANSSQRKRITFKECFSLMNKIINENNLG